MELLSFGLHWRMSKLTRKMANFSDLGGPRSTMDSVLASHPAAPGSIFGVPEVYLLLMSPRFIDSSALLCIKWTVQKLYTVERTT